MYETAHQNVRSSTVGPSVGKRTSWFPSLRQQGLASANQKLHRNATEGFIHSCIHAGAKIGVLIEVNCETDFVGRQVIV